MVPPEVDRIWDIWGSYSHLPKALFYLLKGNYKPYGREGLSGHAHVSKQKAETQKPNPATKQSRASQPLLVLVRRLD